MAGLMSVTSPPSRQRPNLRRRTDQRGILRGDTAADNARTELQIGDAAVGIRFVDTEHCGRRKPRHILLCRVMKGCAFDGVMPAREMRDKIEVDGDGLARRERFNAEP